MEQEGYIWRKEQKVSKVSPSIPSKKVYSYFGFKIQFPQAVLPAYLNFRVWHFVQYFQNCSDIPYHLRTLTLLRKFLSSWKLQMGCAKAGVTIHASEMYKISVQQESYKEQGKHYRLHRGIWTVPITKELLYEKLVWMERTA